MQSIDKEPNLGLDLEFNQYILGMMRDMCEFLIFALQLGAEWESVLSLHFGTEPQRLCFCQGFHWGGPGEQER